MRSELRDIPDRLLHDLAGAPVVDEAAIDMTVALGFRVGHGSPRVELWPREVEVLRYLSRGLTRVDVAEAMGVSVETVKTHLVRARFVLRAKSTPHACCEAIRRGLIT